MIYSHLHSYLINHKIAFKDTPSGVEINRSFYDYNKFRIFKNITWMDSTFIINL